LSGDNRKNTSRKRKTAPFKHVRRENLADPWSEEESSADCSVQDLLEQQLTAKQGSDVRREYPASEFISTKTSSVTLHAFCLVMTRAALPLDFSISERYF
jgi:hypothetical protein